MSNLILQDWLQWRHSPLLRESFSRKSDSSKVNASREGETTLEISDGGGGRKSPTMKLRLNSVLGEKHENMLSYET